MSIVTPNTSPADLLTCVRGIVTYAHVTSSGRIKLRLTDQAGDKWGLVSWKADYSPSHPEVPDGKTIVDAALDTDSGVLTVDFSDRTYFTLAPNREPDDEGIEDWELFTPDGLVLSYGPRGRWQLASAGDPA
jgi:hypothetical protein